MEGAISAKAPNRRPPKGRQKTLTSMKINRLKQISLRGFLILITLFGVALGLYIRRVSIQKSTISAIKKHGGRIVYRSGEYGMETPPAWAMWFGEDSFDYFFSIYGVHLSETEIDDAELDRLMPNLTGISDLNLDRTKISDRGLRQIGLLQNLQFIGLNETRLVGDDSMESIANLKKIEQVYLWHTQVSDRGAIALAKLPELESLVAGGTKISDKGIAAFEGSPKMRSMVLQWCPISDNALRSISTMPKMKELALTGANLTDDGIMQLSVLPQLKEISVNGTQVTREGALKLKAALPAITINGPFAKK